MKKESMDIDERYGKEFAGHYVFAELTWARRSSIVQKNTKYHPRTGALLSSDLVAIQAESVWASLQSQPEHRPITLEKLKSETEGIPYGLGEKLAVVVNKLCGLTADETDFLSSPSDAKQSTQQSPSIDSAKNSAGP